MRIIPFFQKKARSSRAGAYEGACDTRVRARGMCVIRFKVLEVEDKCVQRRRACIVFTDEWKRQGG